MVTITEALPNELNLIQDIAYKTWPATYGEILTEFQLLYMLKAFYSVEALNENLDNNHHFLLAKEGGEALGFASYVHDYPENGTTKIPKIYVLPQTQGKGIGQLLIDDIVRRTWANGNTKITLNVNRNNNARFFYEKMGFQIVKEEDIDLGSGVVQEDYVMVKTLG